jgi:hypothetical protein
MIGDSEEAARKTLNQIVEGAIAPYREEIESHRQPDIRPKMGNGGSFILAKFFRFHCNI